MDETKALAFSLGSPDHEFLLCQSGNEDKAGCLIDTPEMRRCPLPPVNGRKTNLKKYGRMYCEGVYLIWGEDGGDPEKRLPKTALYVGRTLYLRIRLQQHWNGKTSHFWKHLCNWLAKEKTERSFQISHYNRRRRQLQLTLFGSGCQEFQLVGHTVNPFDYFSVYPVQVWLMPNSTEKEREERETELRYLFKPVLNQGS